MIRRYVYNGIANCAYMRHSAETTVAALTRTTREAARMEVRSGEQMRNKGRTFE